MTKFDVLWRTSADDAKMFLFFSLFLIRSCQFSFCIPNDLKQFFHLTSSMKLCIGVTFSLHFVVVFALSPSCVSRLCLKRPVVKEPVSCAMFSLQASPVVSAEKYSSINGGTHHVTSEDTPKKKKGIFSKGKQMFKKIAKSHHSQNAKR